MRAPFSPSEELLHLQYNVFLALGYELCLLVTTKETDSVQWSNGKQHFSKNKFHYQWHHYYYIPNIQVPELNRTKCRLFFMPKYFPGCTSLHAGAYPKRAPSLRWLQTHLLSYPHDDPEMPDHSLVKHSMKTQLQNCSSWRPNPHLVGWGRAVLSPKLRDHRAQNDATSPLEGQEAPVTEREAGVCQPDSN